MAYSTQRSVSDGTLRVLMLDIEFFDKSEITAYFNSIPTTAYVWATDRSLRFDANVPAGVEVLVRRTTDLAAPRHVFTDGAQFKASTLDEDFRQILHIAQEAVEGANVGDIYQPLNMHGNPILNVGPTTSDNDAVSLGQVKIESQTAWVAAAQAAASSNVASAQATFAQQWAVNPVDVPVTAGKFSAYHYSVKAQVSSANAEAQANGANAARIVAEAQANGATASRVAADAAAAAAAASASSITGSVTAAQTAAAASQASAVQAQDWANTTRSAAVITYEPPTGPQTNLQALSGSGGAALLGGTSGNVQAMIDTLRADLIKVAAVAGNRPLLSYQSTNTWNIRASHAFMGGFRYCGSFKKMNGRVLPLSYLRGDLTTGTNGLGAESTDAKENWYAAFAVANAGDTSAGTRTMPFLKVIGVSGLVLTLGKAGEGIVTDVARNYSWKATNNLAGCDVLVISQGGSWSGQVVKATANNAGTLTVDSATNIAVGSFLLPAPPGFTEYGYLGSVYMDTSEIRNFFDDGRSVQQYMIGYQGGPSGTTATAVALNFRGYVSPLAVSIMLETAPTWAASTAGAYAEDFGGDSSHFAVSPLVDGTYQYALNRVTICLSYLYQTLYYRNRGPKAATMNGLTILVRGYIEP